MKIAKLNNNKKFGDLAYMKLVFFDYTNSDCEPCYVIYVVKTKMVDDLQSMKFSVVFEDSVWNLCNVCIH